MHCKDNRKVLQHQPNPCCQLFQMMVISLRISLECFSGSVSDCRSIGLVEKIEYWLK